MVGAYCKRGDRQLELGCTRVTTVRAIMSPHRRMWDVTEGLDPETSVRPLSVFGKALDPLRLQNLS